jgi:hypothetical protein
MPGPLKSIDFFRIIQLSCLQNLTWPMACTARRSAGRPGPLAAGVWQAIMDRVPLPKRRLTDRLRVVWRTRLRPLWEIYEWAFWGGLVGLVVILGGIYLAVTSSRQPEHGSGFDSLYRTVLSLAGMLITVGATAKTLALIFQRQLRACRLALSKNHVVVCGLGNKGSLFARGFFEDGYNVVVVEKSPGKTRVELFQDLGMLVVTGNATDQDILKKARVDHARYLVAACREDGDNAEIAVNARALLTAAGSRVLTCLVHITEPFLCNLLKEREIMAHREAPCRLEFFNVFETGARRLLKDYPPFEQPPGDSPPHLLIVGLGALGKSLAVHAAMLWRLAAGPDNGKLAITLVDQDADKKKAFLELQYPLLNGSWDLRAIPSSVDSAQFYEAGFLRDDQHRCVVTTVYICLEDDSRGLAAALTLFQQLRHEKVPVVVQMTHDEGLSTLLAGRDSEAGAYARIHAFGLYTLKGKTDLLLSGTHEILARAIHQEYVDAQKQLGQTPEANPLLVPWDELPEALRESNRRQADDIGKKLTAIQCGMEPLTDWNAEMFSFTPGEVELMASMEHERWLQERCQEGWTFAPGPKNLDCKTNPALLNWEELPEDLKDYNRVAVHSLPVFLAKAGFQIFRIGPPPDLEQEQPSV